MSPDLTGLIGKCYMFSRMGRFFELIAHFEGRELLSMLPKALSLTNETHPYRWIPAFAGMTKGRRLSDQTS